MASKSCWVSRNCYPASSAVDHYYYYGLDILAAVGCIRCVEYRFVLVRIRRLGCLLVWHYSRQTGRHRSIRRFRCCFETYVAAVGSFLRLVYPRSPYFVAGVVAIETAG
jgi:hypothetical protein